jgi:hypothetical protein
MKKLLLILALGGCSYNPVVDLRVSADKAQLLDRDVMECRALTLKAGGWAFKPIMEGSAYQRILNQCLKGRGHSVLSDI